MRRFVLLLLAVCLSSSSSYLQVFMDASNCVLLKCEWRGVGEHCKPAKTLHRAYHDGIGQDFKFLDENESDADLLTRIQRKHPVNTFTIVKDDELGEMCEGRRLWCNATSQYFEKDYEGIIHRRFQHRNPLVVHSVRGSEGIQCRCEFSQAFEYAER